MIELLFSHLRSLVGIVFTVVYTVIWAILIMTVGLLGFESFATKLVRIWCLVLLKVFGIRVVCEGEEKLPARGGAIIAFNHQSHFDIPALGSMTRKQIRFGAKIELFKIPFFGAAMRALGTLPIARESRSDVFRVYKEAEESFKKDKMFILAPEGTRQPEPVIGRFKKGPFIFAINGGVPVVPVVIRGAHAVLPKKSLGVNIGKWSRTIHVRVLPPVDSRSYTRETLEPFVETVRNKMVEAYASMPTGE